MSPGPAPDNSFSAPAVAILGVDAVLAARPATAVQLAHACLAAGYAAAFPASWGDELVAEGCIRRLGSHGAEPAVMCSCPLVAERLAGSELTPMLVSLIAPPVACARYLRAAYAPAPVHITYVGDCPSASDPALDARLSPSELLAHLAARDIVLEEQPLVFDSVLPPDRRRFYSLPGGVPAPEWLAAGEVPRTLVEIDAEDYRVELAERLLAREPVLLDLAPRLRCACSGATGVANTVDARAAVVSLEPPRSSSEILSERVHVDVDRPIPVVHAERGEERAPMGDEEDTPSAPAAAHDAASHDDIGSAETRSGSSAPTPPRRLGPPGARRTARRRTATTVHPPAARTASGRVLPRAYLAHRPKRRELDTPVELADRKPVPLADQMVSEPEHPDPPLQLGTTLSRVVAGPLLP